jgi:hypothetical protein
MIAFLHADPFMHPLEVSWSLAEIFHTRLGKTFNRKSIPHKGQNKYLGHR